MVQTQIRVEKTEIPQSLLECQKIEKKYANTEKDIILLYIDLYKTYIICYNNIIQIKNLQER